MKLTDHIKLTLVQKKTTEKLSTKKATEQINQLKQENEALKTKLYINQEVYNRMLNQQINLKYKVIENPLLLLPSGNSIYFNKLNKKQLNYLENLATPKKKVK